MNYFNYVGGMPPAYIDPFGLWSFIRWVYTGDGNASDDVYHAATSAAGEAIFQGAGASGQVGGSGGPMAAGEYKITIWDSNTGQIAPGVSVSGEAHAIYVDEGRRAGNIETSMVGVSGTLTAGKRGLEGRIEAHIFDMTYKTPCVCVNGLYVSFQLNIRFLGADAHGGFMMTPSGPKVYGGGMASVFSQSQNIELSLPGTGGTKVEGSFHLVAIGGDAELKLNLEGKPIPTGGARGAVGIGWGGKFELVSADAVRCP